MFLSLNLVFVYQNERVRGRSWLTAGSGLLANSLPSNVVLFQYSGKNFIGDLGQIESLDQRHPRLADSPKPHCVIGRIKTSRPRAKLAAWVRSGCDNRWNAYDPQVSTGSAVAFFRLPLGDEPVGTMAGFELSSAGGSGAAASDVWFRSR